MYSAGVGADYVELHNGGAKPINLKGYRIGVTGEGAAFDSTYNAETTLAVGIETNSFTFRSGALPDQRGVVTVYGATGELLLQVEYSDQAPWPITAGHGIGHSLVLVRPSYGENDSRAWSASEYTGGSPGAAEPPPDPTRYLVINEFLANPQNGQFDYIELYNAGPTTVDLTGCTLGDNILNRDRFAIPGRLLLPPGGIVQFTENEPNSFSFGLALAGEDVVLSNPVGASRRRVIDAVRFGQQEQGRPTGRYPDGTPGMQQLSAETRGTLNAPPLAQDIVINEIMYHPITDNDDDEYVELYNRGSTPASVCGWVVAVGNQTNTIPNGTPPIPPGGYLLLANNAGHLKAKYAPDLDNVTVVDSVIPGTLSNQGERIALTNGTLLVDEVTYGDGGRWGQWSDGGGSSLELIDPNSDNKLAPNWADSDETQKHQWRQVTFTGDFVDGYPPLEYVNGWISRSSVQYLELIALGAGEFLVDDIRVSYAGREYVVGTESTFDSGLGRWQLEGNHDLSTIETTLSPHSGTGCLRVRASGRGHYLCNRLRVPLASGLPLNARNVTITAWIHWLRGWPEALFRFEGNYLEGVCNMPELSFPDKLGTPGRLNSQNAANGGNHGPAIVNVTHEPQLPSNTAVTVTADVADPDGVASVTLYHRINSTTPPGNWTSAPMTARGGRWSGTIPARPAGTMVAFYLNATDGTRTNRFPAAQKLYPSDTEQRLCLVRFGEASASSPERFPEYHLWISKATRDEWESPPHALLPDRPQDHSGYLDATLVYVKAGESRVIYNAGGRYGGSVAHNYGYTSPLSGVPLGITLPKDDLLRGADELVLDKNPDQHTEQAIFWMFSKMKLFYNHRRFVRAYVNGADLDIYEDSQQPSGAGVDEWFPNDNAGGLYKLDVLWDSVSAQGICGTATCFDRRSPWANFVKNNSKNLTAYRWRALKRAVRGSANDYRDVFALADAVALAPNDPGYNSAVAGLMDVEQWMRVVALIHVVSATDCYGYSIAHHNMYAYKPTYGRWQLWPYDLDSALNNPQPANTDLFDFAPSGWQMNEPILTTIPQRPEFARAYLRALQDTISPTGPLESSSLTGLHALVNDNRTALGNNTAFPPDVPQGIYDYLVARRAKIVTQVQPYNNAVFAVSAPADGAQLPGVNVTVSGTAPLAAKTIKINNSVQPITWTSPTAWTIQLGVKVGGNTLTIAAFDSSDVQLGSTVTRNVLAPLVFTVPSPANTTIFDVPGLATTLSGTAPAGVASIRVNGMVYNVTLASDKTWTIQVQLNVGTNTLVIAALDSGGNLLGSNITREVVSPTFAVTSPAADKWVRDLTVDLSGSAPTNVVRIEVNGVSYGIKWSSLTTWELDDVPLVLGTNVLSITAFNANGAQLGPTVTRTVHTPLFEIANPPNQAMVDGLFVDLSGSMPLDVAAVKINGATYALASVALTCGTQWQLQLPINMGTNVLSIIPLNASGVEVGGAMTRTVRVPVFAITAPSDRFTSEAATVMISGTAPTNVTTIRVNGIAYPLAWTSSTTWDLQLPLVPGGNVFSFAAFVSTGAQLGSALARTVIYEPCGTRPKLLTATADCETGLITVFFDNFLDRVSATNPSNYTVDIERANESSTPLLVQQSVLDPGGKCVGLSLAHPNFQAFNFHRYGSTGQVRVVVESVASSCGSPINRSEISVPFACPRQQEISWSQLPAFLVFPANEQHGGGRPSNFGWAGLVQRISTEPNAAVADDFRSDGRPVEALRWWGSYLPGFEPAGNQVFEDGFVLTFFNAEVVGGLQRPDRLLGSYFANSAQVRRVATVSFDQDGHRVHEYELALFDSALEPGDTAVAKPSAFLGVDNTPYWISIAAQVGRVEYLDRHPDPSRLDWFHVLNDKRATNHFWSWQTSPTPHQSPSVTGGVGMSGTGLLFPVEGWAANGPLHGELDQAFQVLAGSLPCGPVKLLAIPYTPDEPSTAHRLVVLTWDAPGYILQESINPGSGWQAVSHNSPTVISVDSHRFFRLVCEQQ